MAYNLLYWDLKKKKCHHCLLSHQSCSQKASESLNMKISKLLFWPLCMVACYYATWKSAWTKPRVSLISYRFPREGCITFLSGFNQLSKCKALFRLNYILPFQSIKQNFHQQDTLAADSEALALTCFKMVNRDLPGPHSKVLGKWSPWGLS